MVNLKVWLAANWKYVTTILAIVSAIVGVKFTAQVGPPGTPPEVIVIIPGDLSVQGVQRAEQPVVLAAEWVLVAKIAIKVAIAILEKRAPLTPSDRDDKLLGFLKLIAGDRAAFERANAAAMAPAK